ncbi:MAG: hypothetical protein JO202_14535 [Ktedonobacteraceae bacterium]|nr:hypothetical protein [Ktedonobacteraceae bacterium]
MITFEKYRKVARTRARLLTAQDYEERHGLIHAPEGILAFTAGDYVARDAKGEWPIRQVTMRERYVKVAPEDAEGFAHYVRTDTSFAAQMPEPFTIDGMHGKAGDYLVINEGAGWPVDHEIFEQTYQLAEQNG